MSRTAWAWGRLVGSALTLAVLVWRLGTGPFLDGLRTVDGRALAAAAGLAVLTTVCCAWRWRIVAGGLGVELSLPAAVAAYYRSLFLNLTLPGGIVGDVHRGVSHGRDVSDVGRCVAGRRVGALRRTGRAGRPDRRRSPRAAVARALVHAAGGDRGRGGGVRRRAHGSGATRRRPVCLGADPERSGRDIRDGLLARRAWPGIALASALVVGGHAVTFLIAARTAGITAPPSRMLPIALLVMLAMVLPSVGGWGPREGVTAWAFGAAGLGAQRGVATAVVYGVMVLVASLPGAAVLVVAWFRRTRPPGRPEPPLRERAAHA